MGNQIAQWEAPPLSLATGDFGVSSLTSAIDWSSNKNGRLQTCGAGSSYGWVSTTGTTGGTTVIFKIQTSADGVVWGDFVPAFAAISGDAVCTKIHGGEGKNLCKKPLKYVRLNMVTAVAAYTAGTLRWGLF